MNGIARKIGFFTAFIVPVLVVTGFYLGGNWNFIPIIFAFAILPVIDHYAGTDPANVPVTEANRISKDYFYRFITYVWTYCQMGFMFWGAYAIATEKFSNAIHAFAFVFSFSLVTGGIGITVAHELGHKKSWLEQLYSRLLLMSVSYMHFLIEHNRGHHVYVATPVDPATARKNETFYRFWVRSVLQGYAHAWQLENERLRKKGSRFFSVGNQMIWFLLLPIAFAAVLTAFAGVFAGRIAWEVPAFFLLQSIFAFTLLELVNYVEHYGIQRKEIAPGKYERVNPLHSWNASHIVSNFFLFQLQRHSDHHVYAGKRYQVLNHYDESPQLPYGYQTMILLALIPPLWFKAMNARLEHWQQVALQRRLTTIS